MSFSVDFSTFCHSKDGFRLHHLGQLKKQVESNNYKFNQVIVIHQLCHPTDFDNPFFNDCDFPVNSYPIPDLDNVLRAFSIDLNKQQYTSDVDKAHTWKNHVANHLAAVMRSGSDYMVFADSDCWMIHQPTSWVELGIKILDSRPDIFLISPNDGESERLTQVMSQQMFMVRTHQFRNMDFNQPGWDGNPHVPGGPFPEYWALLEGRMEIYCKYVNKYRYVLSPEYRYWHHNRYNEEGYFETRYDRY